MFPDFVSCKKIIAKRHIRQLAQRRQQDPLLAQMPVIHLHEGRGLLTHREDGSVDPVEFESFTHEFSIGRAELQEEAEVVIEEKMKEASDALHAKHSQVFLAEMEKAAQQSGNVVNAGGRRLTPELYLELLEKMEIDFHPDGSPRIPSLVMSPEMARKMVPQIQAWGEDPDFRKKRAALLETKRNQWYARESNRKLVD
jgi:hypothetical protein